MTRRPASCNHRAMRVGGRPVSWVGIACVFIGAPAPVAMTAPVIPAI